MIDEPKPCDILCGKQQRFNKHFGNQIFRQIIKSFDERYSQADRKEEKMEITKHIVHVLKTQYGSRFIKPCRSGRWREVTDQVARDKVSHALRFAARQREGLPGPTMPVDERSPGGVAALSNALARTTFDDDECATDTEEISDSIDEAIFFLHQQELLRDAVLSEETDAWIAESLEFALASTRDDR